MDTPTKACKACGAEKPLIDFHFYKTGRSAGRPYGRCKACCYAASKRWAEKHPARFKELVAKSREKHGEKYAAKKREWMKRYRLEHPEISLAWRKANPGRLRELLKAWRAKNPERQRQMWKTNFHRRRAAKLGSEGHISAQDERDLFEKQKGRCPVCGKKMKTWHLDHIVPLSRGGHNVKSNAQLLHPICNQRKHAKDPVEFMQSNGFLI